MILKKTAKHTLNNTLYEVNRLSFTYKNDLLKFKNYSLKEFYDYAKNIEYKKDPDKIEMILRPEKLLIRQAGDCDCKTVLCLAFFRLKNIPCGFSIVSAKFMYPFHHIFPFVILDGHAIDFDATYSFNEIGNKKTWSKRKDYIIQGDKYDVYIRR
jgi:hypothetical protein